MPRGEGIGVSARIDDEAERQRLKAAVLELHDPEATGGYILRTAAQGVSVESLREDMAYLDKLWHHVRVRATQTQPGSIVHEDLPLALRVLRDELSRGVSRVLVDSPREHADMVAFAAAFMPDAATRIELYAGPRPIFDLHGIEEEIAQGARSQGDAEVRRAPGHRPDGVDDHDRRQYRRLRRSPQSRGDDLPHQPRGGGRDCAAAAPAQPRRHHHHRLHRHARRVASPPGARRARARARRRPCADAHREPLAARAGGDDAQAHPREPGTSAVRAVSNLRGTRLREDARKRCATRSFAR